MSERSELTRRVAAGGVSPLARIVAYGAGRRAGTAPVRLFLVLGRHRRLFTGWLHFAGRLMPGGLLPRRETELVILRVAHLCGSAYEVAHHTRLGRAAGLGEADLRRVADGPAADGWTARERALLGAVDALHAEHDLDDAAWTELSRHLNERERIELCLLAGHYEMLATVIRTLRIEPDPPRRRRARAAAASLVRARWAARGRGRGPARRPPAG
ncbi:carboxymuconolactone decarboxylase family protein [Actinoallomurus sp. NBC_01490]|uniref:carboxymuconolactone decarboxylase family protein n=1 Tax=Actinoallomurus sp. NBC_01490 TaxID=2903557 RepID=UPI002E3332B3|nr:carboxymuconolactone decarboxylase family protein [Actinoallomurus sp. NBC_01490]